MNQYTLKAFENNTPAEELSNHSSLAGAQTSAQLHVTRNISIDWRPGPYPGTWYGSVNNEDRFCIVKDQ